MAITSEQTHFCKWLSFSLSFLSLNASIFTLYIIGTMCQWRLIKKYSSMVTVQLRRSFLKNNVRENQASFAINPMISTESSDFSRNAVRTIEEATTSTEMEKGHIIKRKAFTKFNGYLLLVVSMTFCEILYDINFMLAVSSSSNACYTEHFLDILGGLSLSIWTNIISFVIMYVVTYLRSVDIFYHYRFFVSIAVGCPLILAVLEMTMNGALKPTNDDAGCASAGNLYIYYDVYYFWRVLCIFTNVGAYLIISIKLHRMAVFEKAKMATDTSAITIQAGGNPSAAINALVLRLKYYPIIQIFSRGGALWKQFDSDTNLGSSLLSAICSPSLGICYFLLFLYMQPKALKLTKQLLCGCCLSKSSESVADAAEVAAPEGSVQESIRTLDDDELEYIINQSYCSSTGSARDSAVTDRSRVPDGSVAASPSSFSVTVFPDIY